MMPENRFHPKLEKALEKGTSLIAACRFHLPAILSRLGESR